MMRPEKFMACAFLVIVSHTTVAQNWSNWRGPNANGSAVTKDLPISWSATSKRNVAWIRKTEGRDSSTPVIVDGKVYLSSVSDTKGELTAECLDAATGKTLWKKTLGKGPGSKRGNTMAAPSPVCDGVRVFFLYGTGLLACFEVNGTRVWTRELAKELGPFKVKFIYSASPLLYDGKVILSILRTNNERAVGKKKAMDSHVISFNATSGKTVWNHLRVGVNSKESMDSYATPIIYTLGERRGIIAIGNDVVTCHEPETGKETWRFLYTTKKPPNWRLVPTPVQAGNLLCFTLPRGKHMMAIRCPNDDLTKTPTLAWEIKGAIPDVPTCAFSDGLLYVLDDKRRRLSCVETAAGNIIWSLKLKTSGGFYASPTVANGKVYCISLTGDVFVCATGRTAKMISTFSIGRETCAATMAAAGDSIYLRTPTQLMRIRKQ